MHEPPFVCSSDRHTSVAYAQAHTYWQYDLDKMNGIERKKMAKLLKRNDVKFLFNRIEYRANKRKKNVEIQCKQIWLSLKSTCALYIVHESYIDALNRSYVTIVYQEKWSMFSLSGHMMFSQASFSSSFLNIRSATFFSMRKILENIMKSLEFSNIIARNCIEILMLTTDKSRFKDEETIMSKHVAIYCNR